MFEKSMARREAKTSNSAPRTLSAVGLIKLDLGETSFLPPNLPAMMRIIWSGRTADAGCPGPLRRHESAASCL